MFTDIARSLVGRLRKSFPQLRFECFNPLTERQRLLDLARGCTILFVDIGGNRHLETVLELVTLAKKHLMPHLIVVKSKELKNKAYAYLEQHGLLGKTEELPDVRFFQMTENTQLNYIYSQKYGGIVSQSKMKMEP